jgi:hypothetical protein
MVRTWSLTCRYEEQTTIEALSKKFYNVFVWALGLPAPYDICIVLRVHYYTLEWNSGTVVRSTIGKYWSTRVLE